MVSLRPSNSPLSPVARRLVAVTLVLGVAIIAWLSPATGDKAV